jgi:phage terminase large subunit GpA-like protein
MQRLEFAGMKWEGDDPSTVRYMCAGGCEIEYRHYSQMDDLARWQTIDGYYYEEDQDRFFGPDDNPIEKPRKIGVRIWAAYSYLRPWSYLVDRWIDANKNAKNGNITTLKTVVNTLLGETFAEEGASVDAGDLDNRQSEYLDGGKIPNEVLLITVGADVQGGVNSRIEMEILGHGLENETWSLDYIVIPGDPERKEIWEQVESQLARRFCRRDGVELPISCTFIDSGYLATEVYRFTGPRRNRRVFATKGVSTGLLCNKGTWQGDKSKKSRAILRTVNVDDAKTIIFNRLQIEKPGPGFCHFPTHYSEQHFTQLTNEEKLEKRKKGVLVGYEWRKKGPNEQLDCRAYALGAFEYLNPNMPRVKLRLEKRAEAISRKGEASEVAESKPKQAKKQRNPKQSRGFVGSWR